MAAFYGVIRPFLLGGSVVAALCLCLVGKNAVTGGLAIFFAAPSRRFSADVSPFPASGESPESDGRNVGGGVGGGQGGGDKTLSAALMREWGQTGFARHRVREVLDSAFRRCCPGLFGGSLNQCSPSIYLCFNV
ncbi:hypothetical protein [Streptomyces rugosispiralis]|uniref:Secreted protein n=1 Tax=Streptomyces rugosispiralis TaxID=2967341 RepID=A0ABT1VA52_9ACTN|nr:hypothetical protein [Streptomyces rugosispiralis]MCQ8194273.1 hypothetical protein [Streptomyces rugosispiralis]